MIEKIWIVCTFSEIIFLFCFALLCYYFPLHQQINSWILGVIQHDLFLNSTLLKKWSFPLKTSSINVIYPRMEYCCRVWAGAPSCYLKMLDKLQKSRCRWNFWSFTSYLSWTPGSSCKCSQIITLVDVHLNWLNWCACYSDRLHDFSVIIPGC